ncbi:MAG: DUF6622 family protein [Spirochaetota bacterium]
MSSANWTRRSQMIILILSRTPKYVWFILLALILLGLLCAKDRKMSAFRVLLLPIAMLSFSFYGIISDFGLDLPSLAPWLFSVVAAAVLGVRVPVPKDLQDVRYDADETQFSVPGSWMPLILMMLIFVSKYIITVLRTISGPDGMGNADILGSIVISPWFTFAVCALYGLYSGIFLARALVILRTRKS